jgi:uncharacterized membrane protein
MNRKFYNYMPWNTYFILFLAAAFLLIFPLMFLIYVKGVVEAFSKLGFSLIIGSMLFLVTLAGRTVNIPIKELDSQEKMIEQEQVSFFGVTYQISRYISKKTIIAVNLGGALIPIGISIYQILLLVHVGKPGVIVSIIISMFVIAFVTHIFAKPVKGVGIAIPLLIPPVITIIATLLFGRSMHSVVAYVSGTIGALIGVDLLNLNKVVSLRSSGCKHWWSRDF